MSFIKLVKKHIQTSKLINRRFQFMMLKKNVVFIFVNLEINKKLNLRLLNLKNNVDFIFFM